MSTHRTFAVGVLVFAAVGCSKPAGSPAVKQLAVAPEAAGPDAAAVAKEFLAAVAAGTAKPDALTPWFKAVVAPPVFDADKAKGFSDAVAADYLAKLAPGAAFAPDLGAPVAADAAGFAGRLMRDGKSARYGLRLTKAGGGWAVDWLQVTPECGQHTRAGDAATAVTALPVQWLAEALMANELSLVEGLLSKPLKARLAPPRFASDEPVGFSRAALYAALADVRRDAATCDTTAVHNGPTATGRLTFAGKAGKRVFAVTTAAGDAPGRFLSDDLKAE